MVLPSAWLTPQPTSSSPYMPPSDSVMPETREATLYPPITPAFYNLAVSYQPNEKQDYVSSTADEYRCNSASPQSDRLIIAEDCLSPLSASRCSPSPTLPIKKRKVSQTSDRYNSDGRPKDDVSATTHRENDGIDRPIFTSRGTLKKYHCKRCPYVAITKRNFWDHMRGHIKPKKQLVCPTCPFVTEYKHHLNFHLLNHLNSKPFKCHKCDYSGVSKNMLDSHLKSHSTLRQYRCNECDFASKYFHQLKVHLNKFQHNEGFMLKDDSERVVIPRGTIRMARRKRAKAKVEAATHVDGFSAMPAVQFDVPTLASPTLFYNYDQTYVDYRAIATPSSNFVGDQIVPEMQSRLFEQIAPLDYSRRSLSLPSPSYVEIEETQSSIDLSDNGELVPLDLSKTEVPRSRDGNASLPLQADYDGDAINECSTTGGEVHQEIQQLRANLENMRKYVSVLEHNFYTDA